MYTMGTLLILLMAVGLVYLWFQRDGTLGNPFAARTAPTATSAPKARIETGEIADTPLLGVLEIGSSRIPTITGTVLSVDLIDTNAEVEPEQYFLILQHQELPGATFRVGIGHPNYMTLTRKDPDTNTNGAVAEQNMRVSELVTLLKKGDEVTVDLSFPADQPEIRTTFMKEIKEYEATAQQPDAPPYTINYYRIEKLALPNT